MICEKYMVVRMDDNGVAFIMAEDMTDLAADALVDEFFGHKQTYVKVAYTSKTRPVVVSQYKIVG